MSVLGTIFDVPVSLAKGVSKVARGIGGGIEDAYNTVTADPGAEDERRRKELLYRQSQLAGGFADRTQRGYMGLGQRGAGALDMLQGQAMGQNSISAEQLRQGLQQQQAAQMSMAAGASPRNAAGAARTAAIQMGRAGAGLAGQQALAGLQERAQAQQAYGNLIQGLRGQDLQAALGSRQNAIAGYGAQNAGAAEKSWWEKYGPAAQAGASAIASAVSDRRLKTDIKDASKDAKQTLGKLKPYTFAYKDEKYGAGRQTGVMAQDLERAGLGHAVIDTPSGKMVHGAKLATSLAALMPNLHERLSKLEAKGK
jgi:hypothetical protein